ncbi:unknown [Prevotella sp. CAG:592]|nr:unknown [Prevotella sp. CAG:592]
MKKTNKDNIIETIEEYINSSPIRPVIIWFRQQTIRRRKSHNQMSHFF